MAIFRQTATCNLFAYVFSISLDITTVEIHRLDQCIIDWTTAVAGKADVSASPTTVVVQFKTYWSNL